jgi:hypothetical protein
MKREKLILSLKDRQTICRLCNWWMFTAKEEIIIKWNKRPMDALTANRTWQPSCSHGTYHNDAITSRSRQLLMMGTWLPETFLATIRREIKNTKVTSSCFFLSTLNYDARSTAHQTITMHGQPHIRFTDWNSWCLFSSPNVSGYMWLNIPHSSFFF